MLLEARIIGLLVGGTIMVLTGLVDDLRDLSPGPKIIIQVIASCIIVASGIRISVAALPAWLNVLLTIFWLVGITNAFNIIDIMDGLAAGIGFVACVVFFIIALRTRPDIAPFEVKDFIAYPAAALAGALLAFWIYNRPPARIFMGDMGSLFIGFTVGVIAIGESYTQKNIMGLWLVQESRRTWERQGRAFSYAELADMAEKAPPFAAVIDPDAELFLAPGDMPARIRDYCQQHGQPPPADEGALIRVVLESLALRYRDVLESVEEILGRRMECIHVVGGGIQNELLCQFTATATRRPVIAGPLEATAIGNLMVQALGKGDVASVEEARQVVRNSFQPRTYDPGDSSGWDQAYERFQKLNS